MRSSLIYCTFLALTLAACSQGGSSHGGGQAGDPSAALSKLSVAQRQSFEAWKSSLVKSCDAYVALGIPNEDKYDNNAKESEGLDASIMTQLNGGDTRLFTDSNSLAVVDVNSASSWWSTDQKLHQDTDVNGSKSLVEAEATLHDGHCTLSLFGQKVYEADLAQKVNVLAFWQSGKEVHGTVRVPRVDNIGSTGFSKASLELDKIARDSFQAKSDDDITNFFSKKLPITKENLKKYFAHDRWSLKYPVYLLPDYSISTGDDLIGPTTTLNSLFDGSPKNFPLEIVTYYSRPDKEHPNTPSMNLKWTLTVSISKNSNVYNYSTKSTASPQIIPVNKDMALECARQRATAYLSGPAGPEKISSVAPEHIYINCETLFPDINIAVYESGLMKSLIPLVFAGITPPNKNYYDYYDKWFHALEVVAKQAVRDNKDIRTELDPKSETVVVPMLAEAFAKIKNALVGIKNLDLISDMAYDMGTKAVAGAETLNWPQLPQALAAADNVVNPFEYAAHDLLDYWASGSDVSSNLQFALSINDAYKAEALKAQSLAKSLGYSDFDFDVFDRVIEDNISLSTLQEWSSRLNLTATAYKNYPNLKNAKNTLIDDVMGWLRSGRLKTEELDQTFATINNVISAFPASSEKLLADLHDDFDLHKYDLEFAGKITDEYKQLAASSLKNAEACDFKDWGTTYFDRILQNHSPLETVRKWNDYWTQAAAFVQAEKARLDNDDTTISSHNRNELLKQGFNDTWSSAEFTALTAIAQLAQTKNACAIYKDLSSAAACVGLEYFKPYSGFFFDAVYQGRYTTLAQDFTGYMNLLASDEWTGLKWKMLNTFFGSTEVIWSKCNQDRFTQNSANLKSLVNSLAQEQDSTRKWSLQNQIQDSLGNCQAQ